MIAAGVGCDYEMVSADHQSFRCPRRLLEDRWPWFKSRLDELVSASSALDIDESDVMIFGDDTRSSMRSTRAEDGGLHVSPRRLDVPLSADATVSLLQYFASLSLGTPVQLEIETLSSLLSFTRTRPDLVHLRTLVVHALHEGLGDSSFAPARVYEVAVKGTCAALQIRAVRILMQVRDDFSARLDLGLTLMISSQEVTGARRPPSLHRSTKVHRHSSRRA